MSQRGATRPRFSRNAICLWGNCRRVGGVSIGIGLIAAALASP